MGAGEISQLWKRNTNVGRCVGWLCILIAQQLIKYVYVLVLAFCRGKCRYIWPIMHGIKNTIDLVRYRNISSSVNINHSPYYLVLPY